MSRSRTLAAWLAAHPAALRRVRALRDVARAQVALLVAQHAVWTRPTGELVALVPVAGPDPVAGPARPTPHAWRLAVAVRRAASYGVFRPKCLVRAVALQRMLERDGIRGSQVVIGVRRDAGAFGAHAWVELGGRALGADAIGARGHVRLARIRSR